MWDNNNSHLNDNLLDQLFACGRFLNFWPPWNTSDGPIEWIFNQMGCQLHLLAHEIETIEDLLEAIEFILMNFNDFDATFAKCGY